MGSTCSSPNFDGGDFQSLLTDYTVLLKEKDPHYGDVTLLEHKITHEVVALKEILSKSTSDFQHDMKSLNQKLCLQHPNIVRLISLNSKAEEKLCSSFFRIQFLIEYNDNDLEKEITEHVKNREKYTEEQLWYVLDCVLQGLNVLNQREVTHGDIKPASIFRSRLGSYKIAEQDITAGVPVYAQRVAGVTDAHGYLSPDLLKALDRSELKPKHNAHKSDIFALGMTMLQAATLSNCEELYDWEKNELKQDELQERLAFLAVNYSPHFQRIVGSMLLVEETQRPSVTELIKVLPGKNETAHNVDLVIQEEEKIEMTEAKQTEENKGVGSGVPGDDEPVNSEVKPTVNNTEEEKQYQLTQGAERVDTGPMEQSKNSVDEKRGYPSNAQGKIEKQVQFLIEDPNVQQVTSKEEAKQPSQREKPIPDAIDYDFETDGSAKPTDPDQKPQNDRPGLKSINVNINLKKNLHANPETKNQQSKPPIQPQQYVTQTMDNTNTAPLSSNSHEFSFVVTQPQSISGVNRSQPFKSAFNVEQSGLQTNAQQIATSSGPSGDIANNGDTNSNKIEAGTSLGAKKIEQPSATGDRLASFTGKLDKPTTETDTKATTNYRQPNTNDSGNNYQQRSYTTGTGNQPTSDMPGGSVMKTATTYIYPLGSVTQSEAPNSYVTTYNQVNPSGQATKYQSFNYQPQQILSTLTYEGNSNQTYTSSKYQPILTQPYSSINSNATQQSPTAGLPNSYLNYQKGSNSNQTQSSVNNSIPDNKYQPSTLDAKSITVHQSTLPNIVNTNKFQSREDPLQHLSRRPVETNKSSSNPGNSGFDSTNPQSYDNSAVANIANYLSKKEQTPYQPQQSYTSINPSNTRPLETAKQSAPFVGGRKAANLNGSEPSVKPQNSSTVNQYSTPNAKQTQQTNKILQSQFGIDPHKTDYSEKSQLSDQVSDLNSAARFDGQLYIQGPNSGPSRSNLITLRQNQSNGERLEFVTETYADDSIYQGEKKGPLRHGRGRFYYSDGGLYDGDWKDGTMHGIGTLFYGNGQVAYEGQWFEDQFHGRGAVHNENPMPLIGEYDYRNFELLGDYWVMYDGEFSHDSKEGLGILYLSNGDRFEGEFKGDIVHGHGTYYFLNGRQISGEWWNNRLVQ